MGAGSGARLPQPNMPSKRASVRKFTPINRLRDMRTSWLANRAVLHAIIWEGQKTGPVALSLLVVVSLGMVLVPVPSGLDDLLDIGVARFPAQLFLDLVG